jgi:hypothetical protein
MAGFNIKDIKITSKVEKELPKLLTGEYTTGIPKDSKLTKTAEIEGDEYVKYPEGNIQKAIGPSHEKGGIDMAMPDGTEVISKTTKLTKEDVKYITSQYDIDISTKDSYASVIDKYTKSIGLKKLNDEQADIIATLKKQMENKAMDKETKTLNTDYLSNKIYDTEAKKAPLEAQRKQFFDLAFKLQEEKKPNPAQGEQSFKYGGISGEAFKAMCDKHGLTEEQGRAILGETTRFDVGGTYEEASKNIAAGSFEKASVNKDLNDLYNSGRISATQFSELSDKARGVNPTATKKAPSKLTGTYETNVFSTVNPNRESQVFGDKTYGQEKDPLKIVENLYKNFPDIVSDPSVFGNKIDVDTLKKTGVAKWKGTEPSMKGQQENILALQTKVNDRMKASANHILNNTDKFDKATIDKAKTYLDKETFTGKKIKGTPVEQRVRSYDQLLGDFTSGRYALKMDVITPEESKLLQTKGKYTLNQLSDEDIKGLTPSSQERIARLKEGLDKNADYSLSTYTPEAAVEAPPVDGKAKVPPGGTPIKSFEIPQLKPRYPQLFMHPDQTALPPSGQSPELLVQNRLQRIDPVRIGIENNLQAINKSQQFASEQLSALPPSQRAATMVTIAAASQEAENQAALGANMANAQNIANAEQFNIGQSDKENLLQGQNMLNFEQRTLAGKDKTELDLRRYLNYNHNVAMQNYKDDQKLNLMNSLFPDYQMDPYGRVNYDPSMAFSVQDQDQRNQYMNFMKGPNPITATDAQTLT